MAIWNQIQGIFLDWTGINLNINQTIYFEIFIKLHMLGSRGLCVMTVLGAAVAAFLGSGYI
jgi:hypothetical protein